MSPSPPPLRATEIMRSLGLVPDPWQVEVLESTHPRLLLNCSRQAGKSTVVAILALVEVLSKPLSRFRSLCHARPGTRQHEEELDCLRKPIAQTVPEQFMLRVASHVCLSRTRSEAE